MLNVVVNNAFRLIGTPVNVKVKERLANLSKIKAYSRIGKELTFPLDLAKNLKKPNRTLDTVQQAISLLNTPNEFLKYSLFWIYTITPEQQQAAEFLAKGDLKSAEKIYRPCSDFASIISYSTSLFIAKRDNQAIKILTKFTANDKLKDEFTSFVSELNGQPIELTTEELLGLQLDALLDSYQPYDLLKIYTSINKSDKIPFYNNIETIINEKNAKKLLKKIESAIKSMETLINLDLAKAFHTCDKLIETCRVDLRYLEKSMGDTTEFRNAGDNLAKCILRCSTAYHNKSEDPSFNSIKKSLSLLKKIKNFAHSNMILADIDRGINTLREILSIDEDDFIFPF